MNVAIYVKLVISGLALGSFYAIIALGFSMIFGVTRVFNLAHGELLLIAGYSAYAAWKTWGINFWLTIPIAILVLLAVGIVLYKVLSSIDEPLELNTIVFTFGLALFFQNLMLILFSANYRILSSPQWTKTLQVFGATITSGSLTLLTTSLLAVLILYFIFRHTFWGKILRATIQDREAARLLGINVNNTVILAFLSGMALVGLAGPFFASFHYIYPAGGMEATLIAIIITIVAGVGHVRAIIWAGWGIGIVENLVTGILGAAYREGITAIILIMILLYKPYALSNSQ